MVYALHFKGVPHDPPTAADVEEFQTEEEARVEFWRRVEDEDLCVDTTEMHLHRDASLGAPCLILYGDGHEERVTLRGSRVESLGRGATQS